MKNLLIFGPSDRPPGGHFRVFTGAPPGTIRVYWERRDEHGKFLYLRCPFSIELRPAYILENILYALTVLFFLALVVAIVVDTILFFGLYSRAPGDDSGLSDALAAVHQNLPRWHASNLIPYGPLNFSTATIMEYLSYVGATIGNIFVALWFGVRVIFCLFDYSFSLAVYLSAPVYLFSANGALWLFVAIQRHNEAQANRGAALARTAAPARFNPMGQAGSEHALGQAGFARPAPLDAALRGAASPGTAPPPMFED